MRPEPTLEASALGTQLQATGPGAALAVGEVLRLETVLTRFRASPLSTLNREGYLFNPPIELVLAVQHALDVERQTGGLITPTVLGALRAAGYDAAPGSAPGELVTVPGCLGIDCSTHEVRLPAGVILDLGGTGKGWIAQRASRVMHGAFVLDAGGDMVIQHTRPVAVEIEHPYGGPPGRLHVPSGRHGVATSSVLKRAWPGGHHLIDPRTGRPLESRFVQATALSTGILSAEVLAKLALFGEDALNAYEAHLGLRPSLWAYDAVGQLWTRAPAGWEQAA
ncbi:FAD:protein FMN transferase [Deinococcus koreensis]|nr:FAD:protein FMN transferase [Deinococcus koreensis]